MRDAEFPSHRAKTVANYEMSLLALGWADELADVGIASNALWPRTLVATAAVQNLLGGDAAMQRSRRPDVYADAAYEVLSRDSVSVTARDGPVIARCASSDQDSMVSPAAAGGRPEA